MTRVTSQVPAQTASQFRRNKERASLAPSATDTLPRQAWDAIDRIVDIALQPVSYCRYDRTTRCGRRSCSGCGGSDGGAIVAGAGIGDVGGEAVGKLPPRHHVAGVLGEQEREFDAVFEDRQLHRQHGADQAFPEI